jgi:putative isomerase
MHYDPTIIPLSRYGSYMALRLPDRVPGPDGRQIASASGVWLRNVACNTGWGDEILRFVPVADGNGLPLNPALRPELLTLTTGRGDLRFCFERPDVLRLRGDGVGCRLHLLPDNDPVPFDGRRWLIIANTVWQQYMITPLSGEIGLVAAGGAPGSQEATLEISPDPASGICEAVIHEFDGSWQPCQYAREFDEPVAEVAREFADWLELYPPAAAEYEDARRLAAYVNWSSTVAPRDNLRRPAMFMSKNRLCRLWSWDNCFNAIALSYRAPRRALDQWLLPFDFQLANGQLPDVMSPRFCQYNFVKPPVHGWALGRMMRSSTYFTDEILGGLYEPLCRFTNWWFDCRDPDHDGLPQCHSGNDSGWDNATVFDVGMPVATPDIPAYLVIQMELLAEIASRIGRPAQEVADWRRRAASTLAALMERLWRGDRFVAVRTLDGALAEKSDSLMSCMPIVLGRRLPEGVAAALAGRIQRYMTGFGLASEHPDSPLYEPDGYWRGPVWAAANLLVIDGLRAAGYRDQAAEVARRLCNTVRAAGPAENFDALSGRWLRDGPYTWTASVFLTLLHEYPG